MSLEEIDLIDGRNFVAGVPYGWFAELRREAPAFWHPQEGAPRGGFWAITRGVAPGLSSGGPCL